MKVGDIVHYWPTEAQRENWCKNDTSERAAMVLAISKDGNTLMLKVFSATLDSDDYRVEATVGAGAIKLGRWTHR